MGIEEINNILCNDGFKHKGNLKLSWENIDVTVKLPSVSILARIRSRGTFKPKRKQILFDVFGDAYSGSMLAIMGESGSGKTTLLNSLAGVVSKKVKVKGKITINNKPIDINSISVYVEQQDLFIPTMTVYEYIMFHANLMCGKRLNKDINLYVDEIIHMFGLDKCKNSQIGSPQTRKGISGGECRRLTIAAQIMSNPRLIFLDEPTSGLDSYSADSVIHILEELAKKGCAIICTIHQPSSQLFSKFDRLLLLAEGKVVYLGDNGNDAINHFARINIICPINYNPADFFIESIAIKKDREEESRDIIKKLVELQKSQVNINKNDPLPEIYTDSSDHIFKPKKMAPISIQFITLLKRSWYTITRDPILFRSRVIQVIVVALIFGLVYLRLDYNLNNVNNFAGAIFSLITQNTYSGVLGVIFVFPLELAVFKREHRRRLYSTSIYFITKTITDIPVFVLMPTIFVIITYFMIGYVINIKTIFTFFLMTILVSLCGISYGYLISTIARDFAMASTLSTPLLMPLMLFGGLFIRQENIPVYFVWISYISWFRYAFDAMVGAQFNEYTILECTNIYPCPSNTTSVNGTYVIKMLGIANYGILINSMSILGLIISFRVLALIALIIRTRLNK